MYVNDLEAYKGDRNFYYDIDKLPFARAEDNPPMVMGMGLDEEVCS